MLEEAREDHKESDAVNMRRKCKYQAQISQPFSVLADMFTELYGALNNFCTATLGWRWGHLIPTLLWLKIEKTFLLIQGLLVLSTILPKLH